MQEDSRVFQGGFNVTVEGPRFERRKTLIGALRFMEMLVTVQSEPLPNEITFTFVPEKWTHGDGPQEFVAPHGWKMTRKWEE